MTSPFSAVSSPAVASLSAWVVMVFMSLCTALGLCSRHQRPVRYIGTIDESLADVVCACLQSGIAQRSLRWSNNRRIGAGFQCGTNDYFSEFPVLSSILVKCPMWLYMADFSAGILADTTNHIYLF